MKNGLCNYSGSSSLKLIAESVLNKKKQKKKKQPLSEFQWSGMHRYLFLDKLKQDRKFISKQLFKNYQITSSPISISWLFSVPGHIVALKLQPALSACGLQHEPTALEGKGSYFSPAEY